VHGISHLPSFLNSHCWPEDWCATATQAQGLAGLGWASRLSGTSFQCMLRGSGDSRKAVVKIPLIAECYQRSSLLMALVCVRGAAWFSSKL